MNKKNNGKLILPPNRNPFKKLTRRDFVKATAVLAGAGVLSTFNGLPVYAKANMDELMPMFAKANIDWKQAAGTEIIVGGLQHPWFEKHSPFLDSFKELTGITVKQEIQSDTEYTTEVPVKLGGGSKTPDVYMVWALGQSVAAGWLEPLDGYYSDPNLTDLSWYKQDDIFNSAKAFPVWAGDNVTYAMSVTAEAETLFTNKTMFDKAGLAIPKTMSELYDAAVALKTDDHAGIVLRGKAAGDAVTWPGGGFIFSYGGAIVDANGEIAFDSPEAMEAIDMYGKICRDGGPIGIGSYHWFECLSDFMEGKSAMGLDSSNFATDFANPEKSKVADTTVYGAMPSAPGQANAKPNMWHWMIGMNANSAQKTAAWLFMQWVTSPPTSLMTSSLGLATTRKSAWASGDFMDSFGDQAASASLSNLSNADGDLFKYAWFHPEAGAILDQVAIALNSSINGENVEKVVKKAADKARRAIS